MGATSLYVRGAIFEFLKHAEDASDKSTLVVVLRASRIRWLREVRRGQEARATTQLSFWMVVAGCVGNVRMATTGMTAVG